MEKWGCTVEKLVSMEYKNLFEQTYQGKKVFLTGHTGFKGTWLLSWLRILGAEIKGYALEAESPSDLYNFVQAHEKCESVIADIRDFERLEKEILEFKPDFIFHLAAQPLVRKSYDQPLYTFEVNVSGTINILQAIKGLKKKCTVIVVTTDKVYENNESGRPFEVDDKLGGYDPYSASKAMAELAVSCYRNSFFTVQSYENHKKAIASVRAGNVIGGGDMSMDRIIPDIIRAIENGNVVELRKPNSVRPWQFVLEPLSGYLMLGSKLSLDVASYSSAWNFGPESDEILSVKEMTELFIGKYGKGQYQITTKENDPHEAGFLMLSIEKTIEKLGWRPKFSVAQSIEFTVKGYQQIALGNRDFIDEQISEYCFC